MADDDDFRAELRSYLVGLGMALLLSALAFACVAWHVAPRSWLLWLIAGTALLQIIGHFRFFLHIDLSRSKRDDLQLILFSTLIGILMVGGTIWIFYNQQMRMM